MKSQLRIGDCVSVEVIGDMSWSLDNVTLLDIPGVPGESWIFRSEKNGCEIWIPVGACIVTRFDAKNVKKEE